MTGEDALAAAAVAFAALIQASVGFGYALLAAPMLALIAPQMVPGPVMLSSMLVSLASSLREHRSIDRRGVTLALMGRVPGVALGAAAMAWMSPATMSIVFAAVVLAGVALSVSGLRIVRTTRTLLGTGFLSGVMGTMTSIGGPPMALVYQNAEGPELRATLNTYFALGSAMSIPALAIAGHFGREQVLDGMLLLPATFAGFAVSGFTRSYLDAGRTRAAVLAVATVSALAVVGKELLG